MANDGTARFPVISWTMQIMRQFSISDSAATAVVLPAILILCDNLALQIVSLAICYMVHSSYSKFSFQLSKHMLSQRLASLYQEILQLLPITNLNVVVMNQNIQSKYGDSILQVFPDIFPKFILHCSFFQESRMPRTTQLLIVALLRIDKIKASE